MGPWDHGTFFHLRFVYASLATDICPLSAPPSPHLKAEVKKGPMVPWSHPSFKNFFGFLAGCSNRLSVSDSGCRAPMMAWKPYYVRDWRWRVTHLTLKSLLFGLGLHVPQSKSQKIRKTEPTVANGGLQH